MTAVSKTARSTEKRMEPPRKATAVMAADADAASARWALRTIAKKMSDLAKK